MGSSFCALCCFSESNKAGQDRHAKSVAEGDGEMDPENSIRLLACEVQRFNSRSMANNRLMRFNASCVRRPDERWFAPMTGKVSQFFCGRRSIVSAAALRLH